MAPNTAISISHEAAHQTSFAVSSITAESAASVSELLTKNHREHHIYFNDKGFHNHIVHHLLTLLALGATPDEIRRAYDGNAHYQRDVYPIHERVLQDLSDQEIFRSCLYKEEHYTDYLAFFTTELDKKGIPAVVNEYLFSRTPLADNMLARLFGGVVHPLLHLGFALETMSSPLVAESLAMTAVHSDFLLPTFLAAESAPAPTPPKTLHQLLQDVHSERLFATTARTRPSLNLVDGITTHLPDLTTNLLSQYRLPSPTLPDLPSAIAEQHSTLANLCFTSQHPSLSKRPKLDFFLIHALNASFFSPVFDHLPWLRPEDKIRLWEWKGRHDALLYAGVYAPTPVPGLIQGYQPLARHATWSGVFASARKWGDDGHCAKVVRALAAGEKMCGGFEGEEWCTVKAGDWLRYAGVVVESMGGEEGDWVRFAGDDGAWEGVLGREEWEGCGREVRRIGNAEAARKRLEGMRTER
ncbi:Oxidoreductase [Sphaceloma murrayae]|uniref:Oxidoreductase n=1 Tax=Sphaceloma murrayae TaxID=2082308 RepID=A0A2K1QZU1_9PEZI|nr:Oxidoreductase [Sphaceloma murrayae]